VSLPIFDCQLPIQNLIAGDSSLVPKAHELLLQRE
jgi:hypothetical protein